MTYEEKRAWIMLAVSGFAYLVYVVVVLSSADGPLAETPYAGAMLWTIGGAIVASIVLSIIAGIRGGDERDERDRQINRVGDQIGLSFVVIGATAALGLSMLEVAYFWIANAVYLAFALSAVVGPVAKIVAYRRGGFQEW